MADDETGTRATRGSGATRPLLGQRGGFPHHRRRGSPLGGGQRGGEAVTPRLVDPGVPHERSSTNGRHRPGRLAADPGSLRELGGVAGRCHPAPSASAPHRPGDGKLRHLLGSGMLLGVRAKRRGACAPSVRDLRWKRACADASGAVSESTAPVPRPAGARAPGEWAPLPSSSPQPLGGDSDAAGGRPRDDPGGP